MSRRTTAASRGARFFAAAILIATTAMPLSASAVVAASGPNLVQNGSFESPALATDSGSPAKLTSANALPGWTLSGTVDLVRCAVASACPATGYPWAAGDGAQSVNLEGTISGTVSQAVPTIAGHTYTFSFAYMPGPLAAEVDAPESKIFWNGTRLKIAFRERQKDKPRAWITATATVVASAASTVITFQGNGDKRSGFALDGVSVVDNDAGPATPPPAVVAAPELLRAAPISDGSGSAFAGRILAGAGTYQVTFYAAATCAGIGFGAPALGSASITLDAASDTFQATIPATIPAGTPFVAAKVTGPASTPGVAGKISDFGPCVVYSPENDTWPRALDITPSGSGTSTPGIGTWIDQPGVGRWFKVHVVPGGSVTLDLANLPADYDVYLFRDIAQAYGQLTGTTDLTQLSAQFAGSGFAGSGFAGSGFAGSGFAGSGFAGSGFAGSGFAGSGFAPDEFSGSGFAGSGFAGSGFAGSGFAGSGFAGSGFAGSGFAGSGFAGSGFAPEAFSAAQVYSLIAWGNQPYLADEHVVANTWTSTGDFYIRVNGKNGASSLAAPFTLTVNEQSSVCTPVVPQGSKPAPFSNTADTIILTDSSRFAGLDTNALMAKLGELATATNGVVVDLAGNARVQGLQAQADGNAGCVYAENLVASAAKDIIDAFRKGNTGTGVKYVVLAGGDSVLPFFRYPDTSSIGPELNFYPPVLGTSVSEASLRSNYVLGQDAYGTNKTFGAGVVEFPIPDLPVGRLVETPAEIVTMVQAYLDQHTVTPHTSFVSGYDFVADAALQVQGDLAAGTDGTGAADASLITPYGVAPSDPSSWTADQLRAGWLGSRRDISFLGGHFSASGALAADLASALTTADLAAAGIDLTNSVVFSIGCHSGYNTVDAAGVPGVTNTLDWAQAFARQGITSVLGTGYQYGDTDFIAYSEQLYAEFARQLRYGTGPVAIGRALVAAKVDYLSKLTSLGDLHTKSLLESALYGLPMFGIDMPAGRLAAPAGSSPVALIPFATQPALTTGLRYYDFTQSTPSVPNTKQLNVDTGGTLTATWYAAPDGSVQTEPGAPAIPVYSAGVSANPATDPGYVLRGLGFRGGHYADSTVVPLTGAPGTELGTAHTSFNSPTFYPSQLARPNFFDALAGGGATTLVMTPAQHRAPTPGTPDVLLRLYGDVSFRLFYSNSLAAGATSGAPVVYGITSDLTPLGDTRIVARIVGDPNADIQQAWVTFTEPGSGLWQSADLARDATDPTLWTLTRHMAVGTSFMVQAANGFGLVTVNDNANAYYTAGVAAATAATSAIILGGATTGVYGTSASVTATLMSGGSPVPNRLIVFSIGSTIRSGTTNASGVATASIPLASAAGSYTLSATFGGDPTTMGSGATRAFDITPAASLVTITCPASVDFNGDAQVPCDAAVTGAGGLADTLTVSYLDNTAAGQATASASYPGDAAHTGSTGSVHFTIGHAASVVNVTCPATAEYTGDPLEPCSAVATGAGGLSVSPLLVTYTGNTNVGSAGASASYAGDANHDSSSGTGSFQITKAGSSVSISCDGGLAYTGAAQTPCTATVHGAGTVTGAAVVTYTDNVAAGTGHVLAVYAGDTNHIGSQAATVFTIGPASSSVGIECTAGQVYTGVALTPCIATATGAGGFSQSLAVTYGSNTSAGIASASAEFPGDTNHTGSSNSTTFIIGQAGSSVSLSCTPGQVYTGLALQPCSATVNGAGTVTGSATLVYSANVAAGTASVTATYEGDANHTGSSTPTTFAIGQASSSVSVWCAASATYTGAALTPCSATVTGAGTVTGSASVTYSNNVNVGSALASASYAGDTNHSGNSGSGTFQVAKASSSVDLSCPSPVTYTGAALTPCSATASGAGTVTGSATITYTANTGAGAAGASATYAGDANHTGSSATGGFTIDKAGSTTTVTCPASVAATGSPLTPCYATVIGAGGLNTTIDVGYANNVVVGTGSASATFAGDANHGGSTGGATFGITPGAASIAITVIPAGSNPTPQYSDTVTLRATLPAGSLGNVAFTFNGIAAGSASVSGGVANVSLRLDSNVIPAGAGSYTVAAAFTAGAGSTWLSGSGSTPVAVAREGQLANGQQDGSARVDYTGAQLVATNVAPALSAVIRQGRAPESSDNERIDFSRAAVTAVFRIYPAACGATCPAATWTSGNIAFVNMDDDGNGRNGTEAVNAPKLAQGSYLVTVTVNANGFILPQVATSTLAVGTPSGTFLSGAGAIAADSTSNAPVTTGQFGFGIKSGTPPAGDGIYVYRTRTIVAAGTSALGTNCATLGDTAAGSCRDVDTIVRSTGITSLTPNTAKSYPYSASAVGTALVQVVDAADGTTRYAGLELTGATFRVDVLDGSAAGTSDKVGFTVYRSNSTVFHQAFIPASGAIAQTGSAAATNLALLSTGNITIH